MNELDRIKELAGIPTNITEEKLDYNNKEDQAKVSKAKIYIKSKQGAVDKMEKKMRNLWGASLIESLVLKYYNIYLDQFFVEPHPGKVKYRYSMEEFIRSEVKFQVTRANDLEDFVNLSDIEKFIKKHVKIKE